jgi:phosphoglycolate phosphatase-like HAD superfamily hydrolase
VLLLFDIDGTLLLRAAGPHAQALVTSMEKVYGVTGLHAGGMELAGRTDPEIARRFLLLAEVDDKTVDDRFDELKHTSVEEFARICPEDLSDRVNPGMPAVLDELAGGHDLSLVTGNLEPIAHLKLKRAGIGHHFPPGQGGFGSDHEDRTLLPAIARKRAGDHPREDTVVIGDTPRDIACARADDVRVIAIATGPYAVAELEGADAIVTRADELPAAIASLR